MNDEEKKFLTDLVDKERSFHIDLAKSGMRYGAFMALTAALFALGGEELLRYDWLSGYILLVLAVITAYLVTISARKELKKSS